MLEKSLGSTKTLKISDMNIFNSHTGKTCEALILDPDKESLLPERRFVAGFLNAKPTALIFEVGKKSSQTAANDIRKFWDSLR
jgi:hypothetical protein